MTDSHFSFAYFQHYIILTKIILLVSTNLRVKSITVIVNRITVKVNRITTIVNRIKVIKEFSVIRLKVTGPSVDCTQLKLDQI